MRFFSKITFICNACFLVAIILRWVEINRRATGNFNGAIKFQPLEASVVILGYGAIFINVIFLVFCMISLLRKRIGLMPRWIVLTNALIFPLQVYFFFFSP